jgi:hypothetical protein
LLKDFTKFRFKSGHNIESKYEERMKKKGRGAPGRAATQQLAADGQLDRERALRTPKWQGAHTSKRWR